MYKNNFGTAYRSYLQGCRCPRPRGDWYALPKLRYQTNLRCVTNKKREDFHCASANAIKCNLNDSTKRLGLWFYFYCLVFKHIHDISYEKHIPCY